MAEVLSFWQSIPLEELAEQQGVSAAEDLDEIASLWPDEDNPDELLQLLLTERDERRKLNESRTKETLMSTAISLFEYPSVVKRAEELGCQVPTRLALLPRNFDTAPTRNGLLFESETPTVRILWRKAGIIETPIEPRGEKVPQISEKSFEAWIAPVIFVSFSLLSQNPEMVSIALNVISNYLTGWFKGLSSKRIAKLDMVVETRTKEYKRIHYEGPIEGLKDLPKIAREVSLNERRNI